MARYINVDSALQAHPEFLNEQIDDHDKAIYAKGWNACNSAYYGAIKELENQTVDLNKMVPHWISVEERLPETGKVVLLYINCEKSRPHTGFFTEDGMFMHDVLGDMSRSKWKVTHWMPLPKPPKEGAE